MLPINRFPTATVKVTSTAIPTNTADPAVTANPTATAKPPVTTSNVPTTKTYEDATTPRTSQAASNVGTSAAPGTAEWTQS